MTAAVPRKPTIGGDAMGHEQPLGWFSRMLMLAELVTATTLKYRLEFGQAASEPQKPKSNGQERGGAPTLK